MGASRWTTSTLPIRRDRITRLSLFFSLFLSLSLSLFASLSLSRSSLSLSLSLLLSLSFSLSVSLSLFDLECVLLVEVVGDQVEARGERKERD